MAGPKPKQQTILDYTRQLAGLIGLGHWRIDFEIDPAPDDAVACIRVVRGQQRAFLQVGKQYAAQSPEDARSTILHELLHIWCWEMDDAVDAAAPHLGTVGAALLDAQHEIAVERAVDGIACAIASFFPLPA